MLKLIFKNETGVEVLEELFESKVADFYEILREKVDGFLDKQNGVIGLALVNDEAIHLINRDYRKKDEVTDVISFAYLEGGGILGAEGGFVEVGDVFISVETAERQGTEKGHGLLREMEILFVHGMLHLFGYGHEDDEGEAEMERVAGEILGRSE